MRIVRRLCAALIVLTLAMGAVGCEEDPMRRGAIALGAQNADEAEAAFEAALKANPDNVEAKRLLADVHILREDFTKAEESLDALWKQHGFDNESAELSLEQKTARELMEQQYKTLYKKWAEKLDSNAEPEKFERVVAKGLEFEPTSVRLNTLAVNHYTARAERLVEEGKKAEAADAYEALLKFRATSEQREEAEKLASKLRFEGYSETFDKGWDAKKAKLVEAERWNDEKGAVLVVVEADVDPKLRSNNPEQLKQAQIQARKPFALALRQLVVDLAELPEDADFAKAGVPESTIVSNDIKRGKLTMEIHVTPDAIKKTAFAVLEAKREAENAPKDAEKGDEESNAPEASADAGMSPDAAKEP